MHPVLQLELESLLCQLSTYIYSCACGVYWKVHIAIYYVTQNACGLSLCYEYKVVRGGLTSVRKR